MVKSAIAAGVPVKKIDRLPRRGYIFVISGPSGSGKTTLLDRLLKDKALRHKLVKSISFTTRPKRTAERDKRDYFFIPEKEFRQKLKAKKILEWTRYLGYYYATPRDFVERQLRRNKHLILCLDLKGAARIRQLYPQTTVSIFITPPSLEALRQRIEGRCHKTTKEEIRQRLELARRELAMVDRFDYRLVNQNLSEVVGELKGIILSKTGR